MGEPKYDPQILNKLYNYNVPKKGKKKVLSNQYIMLVKMSSFETSRSWLYLVNHCWGSSCMCWNRFWSLAQNSTLAQVKESRASNVFLTSK